MIITRRSPRTGETNQMDLDITDQQFEYWIAGANIQDAFPNLTATEREFILTGYTAEDWDAIFPPEEDEEV